jgi:hypothetical protein
MHKIAPYRIAPLKASNPTQSTCTERLLNGFTFQKTELVREGAQHQEAHNCQAGKKNLVLSSRWEPETKTH